MILGSKFIGYYSKRRILLNLNCINDLIMIMFNNKYFLLCLILLVVIYYLLRLRVLILIRIGFVYVLKNLESFVVLFWNFLGLKSFVKIL